MVCALGIVQWPYGLNSSISGSKEEKTECEK